MYFAKHHVRVNGAMYRPGEVIEADPNAAWHLKVGAIEEIAPVAGETTSDTSPNGGGKRAAGDVVPREEGTDEAKENGEARENYASQLATLGYQLDGTPTADAEPEEGKEGPAPEEIDEDTEPEEIDVMAGIVTEPVEEKPAPPKRKTSTRKREGGKAK